MSKLTRNEALEQLKAWTSSPSLLTHARAVELVMREAAGKYGGPDASPDVWGIAGLLHDADYDQWPSLHPNKIVAWLRDRGEAEIAYAISCHWTKWGIRAKSQMDKALLACDELTGFVMACAIVRPEGMTSMTVKSVTKKLKNRSFAASVERDEIQTGVRQIGVDLNDHIQFVIDALKPHSEELGITGSDVCHSAESIG